jgi:hypothetical protein
MYLELILIGLLVGLSLMFVTRMVLNIRYLAVTIITHKPPRKDDDEGGLDKFYDFPVVIFPTGAPLELLLQDSQPEYLYDFTKKKQPDGL